MSADPALLTRADRQRLLERLAELGDLDRLMRKSRKPGRTGRAAPAPRHGRGPGGSRLNTLPARHQDGPVHHRCATSGRRRTT